MQPSQWKHVLLFFFSMSVLKATAGPASRRSAETANCVHPSLICDDGNNSFRCLSPADICNQVRDCNSGKDEINCGTKNYVVGANVVSTRRMESDAVVNNLSVESCAKLCSEEDHFTCIGFQHNFQTGQCRLLDIQFVQLEREPSLRSFWSTFLSNKAELQKIPLALDSKMDEIFNETAILDAIEGGYDALIVEVDITTSENRNKRQASGKEVQRSSGSCGKRSVEFNPPNSNPSNRLGRVIGGVDAPAGAYPWQVAIKLKDGPGSFLQWCGGAIIDSRFILTAAHCIDQFHRKGRSFVVVAGEHDLQVESSKEQVFEVENFVTHPDYKNSKSGDDIALVKLVTVDGQGIAFNDVAQPICLPSSEEVYKPGKVCSVSGWGMQKAGDKGSVAKILQVASVPLLSGETCIKQEIYGNFLNSNRFPDSMVCAGYLEGKTDACSGDSGGPLACPVDGQFQLLGLVSWGDDVPGGCARKDKPGVYTKTLPYLEWIHTWMEKL